MTRPLDGIALLTYFRRLKLSRVAQELLTHIRTSPPSRTPEARRGNMPIWYPSNNLAKGKHYSSSRSFLFDGSGKLPVRPSGKGHEVEGHGGRLMRVPLSEVGFLGEAAWEGARGRRHSGRP